MKIFFQTYQIWRLLTHCDACMDPIFAFTNSFGSLCYMGKLKENVTRHKHHLFCFCLTLQWDWQYYYISCLHVNGWNSKISHFQCINLCRVTTKLNQRERRHNQPKNNQKPWKLKTHGRWKKKKKSLDGYQLTFWLLCQKCKVWILWYQIFLSICNF